MKAHRISILLTLLASSSACSRPAEATWALNSGGLAEVSGGSFSLGYTVSISVQGDEVEIQPTTSLTKNGGCWDQPANGRLRYTCNRTRLFHCGATFSARGAVGAGDQLVAACGLSGVVDVNSYVTMIVRGDNNAVTPHCVLSMDTNDYLSLWIANETDTDNFTLDSLNLFCMRSG